MPSGSSGSGLDEVSAAPADPGAAGTSNPLRGRSGRWRSSRRRREALTGVAFIGPLVVFLGIFQFWPLLRGAQLSFTTSGFFGGSEWSGLDNYRQLFQDAEVLHAFGNSLKYTLMILAGIPVALVLAALLNTRGLRCRSVYRTLFFLPVVIMPAALGLSWSTLLNGDYGPVNTALEWVGLEGRSWLQDPTFALVAVGVVGVWSTLGYNIVLFLAGLQAIPRDTYEAAAIDGAGKARQFFSVTVPLISPTTFFVSVTSVLTAIQMFDLMYIMIGANANQGQRNPAINDAETVVYLFYEYGFVKNDRGYASAIAVVLLFVAMALTVVQFRIQRRWVRYD